MVLKKKTKLKGLFVSKRESKSFIFKTNFLLLNLNNN